ncbi:hypothetical protein [Abyssalbus ytuae]|uniref:Uncharacterized protein n=1 Tax=Abyssalbus ytuae TaxID=2926907 RepID=A0A9E7D121_9FLAO|nr:hypothetical protein [Abyssalbus ytuae]UOB16598.1 hypothetical protein MQE35_12735 [Abyssalbus ytuae]
MISKVKENINRPAPKWFRKAKKVIYLLLAGALLKDTFTKFGLDDGIQDLIIGWIVFSLEMVEILIANGEVYAKKEELAHVPGGGVKSENKEKRDV